jgi:hypothetical protein
MKLARGKLPSYVVKSNGKMILLLCTVHVLAILGITRDDDKKKPAAFKVYNSTKFLMFRKREKQGETGGKREMSEEPPPNVPVKTIPIHKWIPTNIMCSPYV